MIDSKLFPTLNGKTYPIPEPKLASKDRRRRRLAFRNERNLYKRTSSLSGTPMISVFHADSPFQIYTHEEWWSDQWHPLDFGRDYDFSRSFFEQFYELQLKVPRPPLVNNKAENSPYCNFTDGNKNCHLITSANNNEDCLYCFLLVGCRDAVDCTWCTDSELLYDCVDCRKSYGLKHCQNCVNCSESQYLRDCRGVKNCLMCYGLNNAEYHIYNKPVSKEEFERARVDNDFLQKAPKREGDYFLNSENVSGDFIFNSKNIVQGFDVYDSEDCGFLHDGLNARDCYDICFFDGCELCYESTSLIGYGYRFTNFCRDSVNLFYCDNCHGCRECFGCVGLRNKKNCIFNKQYGREDYEEMMERIILSMDGEWGEFFPVKYSLFAYNETLANDYFPMEKEEVLTRGWQWREEDEREYKASADPDVLSCEVCKKNFKIIPQELKFYEKMRVDLPKKCPETRNKERILKRKR
jgi:hypothetical protein